MPGSERTSRELLEQLQASVQRLLEETAARERRISALATDQPDPPPQFPPTLAGGPLKEFRAQASQLAQAAEDELNEIQAALEGWLEQAGRFLTPHAG